MNSLSIFGLQLILSLLVFALLAKWYLAPWLANKPIHLALIVLTIPHAFRHIGLSFLVPGLVDPSLSGSFASAAGYGDFASGLLAILCLLLLRLGWRIAIPLVWGFNLVGTVDLVNALRQAHAVPYLGATWYIPTFFVPALLVTHVLIFARLIGHARKRSDDQSKSVAVRIGATVLIALASSTLIAQDDRISAEFPCKSKYIKVLGSKMHYIDQGEGDDVFLFLHGNPTSSYLWRNVMDYVAPQGRIIAVDNIGFGKSDKPNIDYTFQSHYRYTAGFIEALGLHDIILVVHDWGSVLGGYYATNHTQNVKGIVMMEPLISPTFPMADLNAFGPVADLFRRFRDPVAGKKALIEENLFIETLVANASITRAMTNTEVDYYRAPFLQPETRYPIFRWPNELLVEGKPARNITVFQRIDEWLRASDTPKLLQYASPGVFMPPQAAQWAAENFPNIETQFIGYGAHFIQEDNPEAIGRGIVDWHRRNRTFEQ